MENASQCKEREKKKAGAVCIIERGTIVRGFVTTPIGLLSAFARHFLFAYFYFKQVRSNKDASKKNLFQKMVLKFCFKILF